MKWNFIYGNKTPFLKKIKFYVYFEGSPLAKKTLGRYVGGSSPILYVPMFPWKYFFSTKWERSQGN
jgi:hypothetical protein